MIVVGLDWSRCKHDFVIMDLQGEIVERGTIAHNTNALEELAARIDRQVDSAEQVRVGLELNDGALLAWLVVKGYTVFGIRCQRFAYSTIQEYKHYSMGQLRGVKRDTWEGGHRIPFIARWDGKIKAGAVSDEVICHVDILATLAAIAGADIPETAGQDSYNIMPALLGQKLKSPIREATVVHGEKGTFAIRKGDWVLIDAPSGDSKRIEPGWFKAERGYHEHKFPAELFNLKDDQAQRQNLYIKFPEKVKELKILLAKYKKDGRSVPTK